MPQSNYSFMSPPISWVVWSRHRSIAILWLCKKFYGNTPCSFICVLPVTAFMLPWQRWASGTETVRPIKPNIFTLCSFTKKSLLTAAFTDRWVCSCGPPNRASYSVWKLRGQPHVILTWKHVRLQWDGWEKVLRDVLTYRSLRTCHINLPNMVEN